MQSLVSKSYSLGFVVFELDVETVFDADLHLDGVVHLRIMRQRMHDDLLFFDQIT